MQIRSRVTALSLILFAQAAIAGAAGTPPGPAIPGPALDPAAVVRIQLDALAHNDQPRTDSGIAVVWRFASPGNRAQTGPLAHFVRMIHAGYAEMIDHRSAVLVSSTTREGRLWQGVELVDRQGDTHRYIFILSRQTTGACSGCWLTDGVIGTPDSKPGTSA